jgi:hypothetical protein
MIPEILRDRSKEGRRSRLKIHAVVASRIVHHTIDRTEPFDDLGDSGRAGIVVVEIHLNRVDVAQNFLGRFRYGIPVEDHGDGAFTS